MSPVMRPSRFVAAETCVNKNQNRQSHSVGFDERSPLLRKLLDWTQRARNVTIRRCNRLDERAPIAAESTRFDPASAKRRDPTVMWPVPPTQRPAWTKPRMVAMGHSRSQSVRSPFAAQSTQRDPAINAAPPGKQDARIVPTTQAVARMSQSTRFSDTDSPRS